MSSNVFIRSSFEEESSTPTWMYTSLISIAWLLLFTPRAEYDSVSTNIDDQRPTSRPIHTFWKNSNGHNLQRVIRTPSCLLLGRGFLERRIERRHFRLDHIQDGGRRPFWKIQTAKRIVLFTLCIQITLLDSKMTVDVYNIGDLFHLFSSIADLRYEEKKWKGGFSLEIGEKITSEKYTLLH